MATSKQIVGTRTSLSFTGLSTLAYQTYVQNTTAYDCSTNQPIDVIIEVEVATTSTPSGNKRVKVFIQDSLNGTNFRTGPTSGTTTTREPNLAFLGLVPLTTSSTTERGFFSIVNALGYVPDSFYIVIQNDAGVALTSGAVYTSEISNTIA